MSTPELTQNNPITAILDMLKSISAQIQKIKTEVKHAFDRDHDLIGRVLKCQLLVESYLNQNIALLEKQPARKSRLRFADKVNLLERSAEYQSNFYKAVRELNNVRNKFAHDLNAVIEEVDIPIMRSYAELSLRKRMSTLLEVIEGFSLVAGAMLANQRDPTFADMSVSWAMLVDLVAKDPAEYDAFFEDPEN